MANSSDKDFNQALHDTKERGATVIETPLTLTTVSAADFLTMTDEEIEARARKRTN